MLPRSLSSKTKSGVTAVWPDKRRKPALIVAMASLTNAFPASHESRTYTPRPAVTGDLLLTNLLSQPAATPPTPREVTPAAELE